MGTKDAIPALVTLLPDEKMNEYARFGLEGIPDPAVDEALRAATSKLQGRPLVGVLDSIGQRKDTKAGEALGPILERPGTWPLPVRPAAGALGRIGTPEAADPLMLAVATDSPIHTGCGRRPAWPVPRAWPPPARWTTPRCSAPLCARASMRWIKKDIPKHLKVAALQGSFRFRKEVAVQLLLKQLKSPENAYFNVALAAVRQMPTAEVTEALVALAPKLPAERQALLILAIGDRRGKDAAPVAFFCRG